MVVIKLLSQSASLSVLGKDYGWSYVTEDVKGRLFQVREANNYKNFSKPQYQSCKKNKTNKKTSKLEISDHLLKGLFEYLKAFPLSVKGNTFHDI